MSFRPPRAAPPRTRPFFRCQLKEVRMEPQTTPRTITPQQKQRIQDALRAAPAQMTLVLARQLGVPEVEIVRALPADRAVELDIERWEELFRAFEDWGDLHVI